MGTNRLEAFSDGVMAILITIMVLELRAPEGTTLNDIKPLLPTFTAYLLSFIYIGIYWNNHHHFWQAASRVTGGALWANLHLLFWLSLLPFATAWLGENYLGSTPSALYGVILLMASIAWYIMARVVVKAEGKNAVLALAFRSDTKTIISMLAYLVAIGLAFLSPFVSNIIYAAVAVYWLVPDKRVERVLLRQKSPVEDTDLIA